MAYSVAFHHRKTERELFRATWYIPQRETEIETASPGARGSNVKAAETRSRPKRSGKICSRPGVGCNA